MTRFDATDRRPVDKWTAAPRPTTSPQGQKPQQKRSTHMVHKPVNSEFSRQAARAVLTVNSSVGLEAMFFEKPVVACGQCFWAIDGVAERAETTAALAEIAADPDSLSFDPSARDAFLGYLTSQYYPRLKGDYELIAARLNGPDDLGFWKCST